MAFQTYKGQPVIIDLPAETRKTSWSIEGTNAIHDSCNTDEIELLGYVLLPGKEYNITYFVNSISGGYVQPLIGTAEGVKQTSSGFKQDTILVTGNIPRFRFISDANCSLKFLTIKDTTEDTDLKQNNAIIYSNKNKKWPCFLTYSPDCGTSMFTNTYTCKNGVYYAHQHGSESRNNFAGVQYKTIVKLPFNQAAANIKSFKSVSVQSNQLLVTDSNGINTSLGQLSELSDIDWVMDKLNDGVASVDVFTKEGVYAASFLRDANEDLINGAPLKGNYLTLELQTTDDNDPLQLFTVQVVTAPSNIGSR